MPPWMAVTVGLMVTAGLALTFPYAQLERALAREDRRIDPLQIAYTQAWLTARPGQEQLRYLFARRLIAIGKLDEARQQLRLLVRESQIRQTAPTAQSTRIALLDLDLLSAELYQLEPDDPERAVLREALLVRLTALHRAQVTDDEQLELAERALQLGAPQSAAFWYSRLLAANIDRPGAWWEEAANRLLGLGEAELAARLFFHAKTRYRAAVDQRRCYIAALRALQSLNLFDYALAQAELQLGPLGNDTATLAFLTRFALAANRPDLAQRYATLMLRLSLLERWLEERGEFLKASLTLDPSPGGRGMVVSPSPSGRGVGVRESVCPGASRLQAAVAAAAQSSRFAKPCLRPSGRGVGVRDGFVQVQNIDHERTPHLPFNDELYRLSYDVFLANRNLADAKAVARSAVRQAPGNLDWRRRLAQVAEWTGDAGLALEQWHAIAKQSNDARAWDEVLRRAPAVFDYTLWLEALQRRYARNPGDAQTIAQIAQAYELIGDPDAGIAFLQKQLERLSATETDQRRKLLEALAQLAENAGRDALRLSTLQTLDRDYGPNATYALQIAALEYERGNNAAAMTALRRSRAVAKADDVDYWRAYAEVSRLLGDSDAALAAFKRVVESGRATEEDFIALNSLLEARDPLAAADYAERAYKQFGSNYQARQVLYLRTRANDRAGVRRFLASLNNTQNRALERDAYFLSQRAFFYLSDDSPKEALHDARAALRLAGDAADIRSVFIWALLANRAQPGTAAELRTTLRRWASAAKKQRELAGPFTAAWLALNEPQQALYFARREASTSQDYLWWLTYADALDLSGEPDAAWSLRRKAWLKLRAEPIKPERSATEQLELGVEMSTRLLNLAQLFEPADATRARLYALLKQGPANNAAVREAALGYWISREQNELTRAWLTGNYLRRLQQPAWAQLSIALAADDRAQLEHLLDTIADWLPIYDRVEAARRVGRDAQAQTLVFDKFAQLPHNEELHARLLNNTVETPDFVGTGVTYFSQKPLNETLLQVDGAQHIAPRVQLSAGVQSAQRRSSDAAQLANMPSADTVLSAGARYRLDSLDGDNAALSARAFVRDGLRTHAGLVLQAEAAVARALQVSARAGLNDVSSDSAFLRIGGMRDTLALSANWRFAAREFASVSGEINRYHSQARNALGSNRSVRLEVGHWLRLSYPDVSLRLIGSDVAVRPNDGLDPLLLQLLPEAARDSASNRQFLPASTTQIGARAVFGETVRTRYTRAWRPFGAVGIGYDRVNGGIYDWELGAGGSVAGTDHLELTATGGSNRGFGGGSGTSDTSGSSYFQLGVRYRWMY